MDTKIKHWLLVGSALALPVLALFTARRIVQQRLHHDINVRFAGADTSARCYREEQLRGLPAPVRRYFRHVLVEGQPYYRGLRLRHGGQFKTALKKAWRPISGEQYVTAGPAGFIWLGTTRWFTARASDRRE